MVGLSGPILKLTRGLSLQSHRSSVPKAISRRFQGLFEALVPGAGDKDQIYIYYMSTSHSNPAAENGVCQKHTDLGDNQSEWGGIQAPSSGQGEFRYQSV